jgi:ketosteroid isomerase-like protein
MTGAVDVLDQFVAAFMRGDMDTLLTFVHPDCVFSEPASLPYGGEWVGPEGLRKLTESMLTGRRLEPVEYGRDVCGDRIVYHVLMRFTSTISGRSVDMKVIEIYTIADGLITDVDIFYKDPRQIAELADPV